MITFQLDFNEIKTTKGYIEVDEIEIENVSNDLIQESSKIVSRILTEKKILSNKFENPTFINQKSDKENNDE